MATVLDAGPTRRFIQDLSDGDLVEEVYQVADRQLRANRNAALYLSLDLRDRTGTMNGRMWNVTEEGVAGIQTGGFVRIKGKVQLFQGARQLILSHVVPVDSTMVELRDFEAFSSEYIQELFEQLREILLSLENPTLRSLMECFLVDQPLMESLSRMPAGVKAHHAYHGGLVEHIVSLMKVVRQVCVCYPDLDEDLMLAGAFLHDIGKLRELSCESGFSYTDEGQLLGHLVIGVEMLSEKIRAAEQQTGEQFPEELAWRLKHLILSHHGSYEFGSPKLPMTPEAMALHFLDNLDAKLHEFHRAINDDVGTDSNWTLFIPRLDRKIYKGRGDATS